MGLTIHVDGGARGNPGPAGAGVVIHDDCGDLVYEAAYFLGRQTNNTAEYHALIRALEKAVRSGAQTLAIHSDSELLVRQLTGTYRVKSPKLGPLFRQVQTLLIQVPRWTVRHVRREENTRADELANLAMDERRDVVVFDADGQTPHAANAAVATPRAHRVDTADRGQPEPRLARGVASAARHAVQISVVRPPQTGGCPAGEYTGLNFTVSVELPAGLCVHAAHAILPTLLAMLNTEAEEFAAVPTLTVRCNHAGCGAQFQLSPVRPSNGVPRRGER